MLSLVFVFSSYRVFTLIFIPLKAEAEVEAIVAAESANALIPLPAGNSGIYSEHRVIDDGNETCFHVKLKRLRPIFFE